MTSAVPALAEVKLRCGVCRFGVLATLIGTAAGLVQIRTKVTLDGDRFYFPASRDLFARRTDHAGIEKTTFPCPRPNRFCRAMHPVRHDRLEAAFTRALDAGVGEVVVPFDLR